MSQFSSHFRKSLLLIGGCTAFTVGFAGGPEPATAPLIFMPALPGVSLYGYGGNGWTGMADIMAPVYGQPLNFFYVDPQIYYHNNPDGYTASIGGGERWLVSPDIGILGAYVFGDYNHVNDGNHFWFASPGLERLGSIIDLSANLYIPVSEQKIDNGTEFADQDGNFSQITFSGHNQYDALVNTFDSTGWGGDAQIGVHLPWLPFFRNSEVFVGGYYFAPKSADNIGGGSVRLQVPINNYVSALFSEAYDSQYHNTLKGGLTFWLGGRHTLPAWQGDLRERMVDPVQRSLIAVAGGSHTGEPVIHQEQIIQNGVLELSNISFFVPPGHTPEGNGGAQGTGTFEDPYINMTQANINDANFKNNYNFYINSGNYYAVYGSSNPDYLVLNNDQLFGRQNNFKQTAMEGNRPVISFTEGGFEIPSGDIHDSFNDLILKGSSQTDHAGIWVDYEGSKNQTVEINDVDVKYFGDGIDILNFGTGTLTMAIANSLISNNSGSGELVAQGAEGGIAAVNNGGGILNLSVNDSTISQNNKTVTGSTTLQAIGGIAAVNDSGDLLMDINKSNISDNANTLTSTFISAVGGIAAVNNNGNMALNLDQSSFSQNDVTATNSSLFAAGGVAVENVDAMRLDIDSSYFSDNEITATNGEIFAAGGLAIRNAANSMTMDIDRSYFNDNKITATNAEIFTAGGLAVYSAADMTLNIDRSNFSDNHVVAMNSFIQAAGGLASLNATGNTMLDIYNSGFNGNEITATNSPMDVAGGLAIFNASSSMTLDIYKSDFNNNEITATDSTLDVGGGLAVFDATTNNMTMDIFKSDFSSNEITATNSFMDTAGGLAIFSTNMTLDMDGSTVSNNKIITTNSTLLTAGGLAVFNTFNMNLDISNSDFNGNKIAATDSFIEAAGGLAIFNVNTMMLTIDQSSFSNNKLIAENSTLSSAGGLAVTNFGNMPLDIDKSDFNDNDIAATNSSLDSAGGLAANNQAEGIMTLDIGWSNFNGNNITATNTSILSAGGLTADNLEGSNMTLDIYHSDFKGNKVTAATDTNLFSAGGLAAFNNSGMTINVDESSFARNFTFADYSTVVGASGGIAIDSLGNTSATIAQSKVLFNDTGIAVNSNDSTPATLTFDQSILAGNRIGLSALNNSQIDVTNPIFFKDKVIFDNTSIITFPDIGPVPVSGAHIFCKYGVCIIER